MENDEKVTSSQPVIYLKALVGATVRVSIPETICVVNETVDISSTRYSLTGIVAVTVAVGAGVKMIVVTTDGTTLRSVCR